eukprot:scaffold6326_cov327-Prasinococcus_capsulatus_cf.AAC.5
MRGAAPSAPTPTTARTTTTTTTTPTTPPPPPTTTNNNDHNGNSAPPPSAAASLAGTPPDDDDDNNNNNNNDDDDDACGCCCAASGRAPLQPAEERAGEVHGAVDERALEQLLAAARAAHRLHRRLVLQHAQPHQAHLPCASASASIIHPRASRGMRGPAGGWPRGRRRLAHL